MKIISSFKKKFGFREGHSCTSHVLVDFISSKFTIGDFIDSSKPFNTIDHNNLCSKVSLGIWYKLWNKKTTVLSDFQTIFQR